MFLPGTRPAMNDFEQQSCRTIATTCSVRPRHGQVSGVSRLSFHRIAYTEWGPEDARRVVVCVHGLSRQGRDFDRLAAFLAQHDYRIICPDLPGRGRSDWLKDPDEYGLPQYCVDMTVLLASLHAQSVDWIGTSLGGLIGMVMAALPGLRSDVWLSTTLGRSSRGPRSTASGHICGRCQRSFRILRQPTRITVKFCQLSGNLATTIGVILLSTA